MQAHSGTGDAPPAHGQPQDDTQQIRQALVSSAQALYAHMVSHEAETRQRAMRLCWGCLEEYSRSI